MEKQNKIFGITIGEKVLLKANDYFGIVLLTVHWFLASVGMFFLVGILWISPVMAFYDANRKIAEHNAVFGIIAAITASILGLIAYFYFEKVTPGVDAFGKEKVPAQSKDHQAYARERFFQSIIFLLIALPPLAIGYYIGLPVFIFILLFFLSESVFIFLHLSKSLMLEMSLLGYYRFHQIEQTSERIIKLDAILRKILWPAIMIGGGALYLSPLPLFPLLISSLITFLVTPVIINGFCLSVIHLRAADLALDKK